MKKFITGLLILNLQQIKSQEFFVHTEPASNRAAKSIGVRTTNNMMKVVAGGKYYYHLMPEIMWGLSKKIQIHGGGIFSNRDDKFKGIGANCYIKYRFYSYDEVHSHFRMAVFARGALNFGDIHHLNIDLYEHNSGYEIGIVSTKLINKLALSLSSSFLHATDNGNNNKFQYGNKNRDAVGYTFSAGKLFFPKSYARYNQTNVNAVIELLGQMNLNSSKSYLEIAPSIQFIFWSKMRIDIGYRFAVLYDLLSNTDRSFLFRVEYNFFNVFK